MAAGRKNFIFFLCLLDGVQFSTTFRYYCLMRVYEWLGLTVTIHGSAITFAKLPTLKRVSCNIAKCSTPLRIGNAGLDIYSGYDAKQPKNVSGYSSPMLNDFTGADQVYIACGYTDLRKGIDGLARLVQQQFELDPFTNTLFLFCGRRRDRIKGLYWEKDGFILLDMRLEQGAYQWPRSESEVKTLTQQQYRWLMEGLQIEQPKAHHPVTGLTAV